jgi:DNA-binding MarR family transcriptional regulator
MSHLAEVLVMDPSTLSRNLRPLEKAALLRIERSTVDGRVRVAQLTREGQLRVEAALPRWQEAHDRVVASLGSDAAVELRERFDAAAAAAAPPPAQ